MTTIYTFNSKVLKNTANDKWLIKKAIDPYNPLGLPTNIIRIKYLSGYTPDMGDTQTLVDSTNNVWDIYKEDNDWSSLFNNKTRLLEVLGANTTDVTDMSSMFNGCAELTTITLFDTSNVTSMYRMFRNCGNITTSIPLFNTSKVTDMEAMFFHCYKVQSGALALYNQASTQTTPPIYHENAFNGCGRNTQTGAAELAQIPSSWGGTGE